MTGLFRSSFLALAVTTLAAPAALAFGAPVSPPTGVSAPQVQPDQPAAAPAAQDDSSSSQPGYSQPVGESAAAPDSTVAPPPPAGSDRPVRYGWIPGHSNPMWLR